MKKMSNSLIKLCIFTATMVGGGYINGSAESAAKDGVLNTQAPLGYCISLVLAQLYKPLFLNNPRSHSTEKKTKRNLDMDLGYFEERKMIYEGIQDGKEDEYFNIGVRFALGGAEEMALGEGRNGEMALLYGPKLRREGFITMFDPFQMKYGRKMGGLLFIPQILGDLFWSAAVLAALGATISIILNINATLAIIISSAVAIIYTFLGGLYSVAYTDVIQLLFIAIGLVIAFPFSLTHPAVDLERVSATWLGHIPTNSIAAYTDVYLLCICGGIPWQASENELIWVLRISILIVGTLGTLIAIFADTIYGLYVLCSDLMYVILFPQLTLILWMPQCNAYGSLAGFLVSFILRLLSGEPVLGLAPAIHYPGYDAVYEIQLFPFRTFIMLIGSFCIIGVSILTNFLFFKGILPRRYDVLKCLKGRTIALRYSDKDRQLQEQDDPDATLTLKETNNGSSVI
ncbi:high-affinity choline transporter 1 [Plakobranchus ocellatus]|uniref:High-affinity choline transporter 1 n=1 Tax=Plakobranchus ocellatus TaxID=259542 RepID=A0AAV3YLB1_9GAST|nr:high-affinity choline transporter 1 [Plakobranchus ocellatus]